MVDLFSNVRRRECELPYPGKIAAPERSQPKGKQENSRGILPVLFTPHCEWHRPWWCTQPPTPPHGKPEVKRGWARRSQPNLLTSSQHLWLPSPRRWDPRSERGQRGDSNPHRHQCLEFSVHASLRPNHCTKCYDAQPLIGPWSINLNGKEGRGHRTEQTTKPLVLVWHTFIL